MHRLVASLLSLLLLTSCTTNPFANFGENLSRLAQNQLNARLGLQLISGLSQGVSSVVDALARPGGYLDNPLVRILLPPPFGLALDLARDLAYTPDRKPLEILLNRAAEHAVPGAGPILQTALNQITADEARQLLEAGGTAGTDHLKAKTASALREALAPAVVDTLTKNNGLQQYAEMLDALRAQKAVGRPGAEPTFDEPITDLGDYVTQQTVEGIFKVLGAEEQRIRQDIDVQEVPALFPPQT